jgi:hypothetical protein
MQQTTNGKTGKGEDGRRRKDKVKDAIAQLEKQFNGKDKIHKKEHARGKQRKRENTRKQER